MVTRIFPAVGLLAFFVILTGSALVQPATAASGTVSVAYAGSLTGVNESTVGPAFSAATGYTYQGKGAGSVALANQVKGKLITPDVLELADPVVDRALEGPANGNFVSWYFTYARSELVIGFDSRSQYAATFRKVQQGKTKWYRALEQRGMRIGRTDPNLDPKGYRTLFFAHLAERVFHLKRFKAKVFGADQNLNQIYPEEVLVARLLTGQVDAGVFYLSEARDLGIPYIKLPAQVSLGSPSLAGLYATQHFVTNKGVSVQGAPIIYTITIPSTVRNAVGAEAFVKFVLSKRLRSVMATRGLLPTKIALGGNRSSVPRILLSFIGQK